MEIAASTEMPVETLEGIERADSYTERTADDTEIIVSDDSFLTGAVPVPVVDTITLEQVATNISVTNELLGRMFAVQIFMFAFMFFLFFYRLIKNNITNFI